MDELPNPITRSEQYLAKIAGAEPTLPTPITREEIYLNAIANNGGGGSSLPDVTSDDKDKFLHTNGSTGALEWAEAGGGGGIPYSPIEYDEEEEAYILTAINSPLYITALEATSPTSADIYIKGVAIEGAEQVWEITCSIGQHTDLETGATNYEVGVSNLPVTLAGGVETVVLIPEAYQNGIGNALLNKIAVPINKYNEHGTTLFEQMMASVPEDDFVAVGFPPLAL